MPKGPREKVGGTQSKPHWAKEQALKSHEGLMAVKRGGGPMATHSKHHTQEAEKAEVASYKLNRRKKF